MRTSHLLILLLCFIGTMSAQEKLSKEEKARRDKNIEAGNPFKQFGYKAKVATLSKGKYLEVHDLDSVVTIGSIRFHVDRKEIVGFVEPDTINDMYARPIGDTPSRWLSPDPLTEEFPEWSPYSFVYNNPLKFNDPTGMAPEDFILTGSQSALDKAQSTMNKGLGGNYTNIDSNGKVTINASAAQIAKFSPEQKAFYDVMSDAIDPTKSDVVMSVVESSPEALVDNYDTGTIDIDDVNAFGNDKSAGADAQFGHAVGEQTQKQRDDLPAGKEGYAVAHNGGGIKSENKISGNQRMPGESKLPAVGTTPGGRTMYSGTKTVPYYNNATGKTQTQTVTVKNNDVTKVKTTTN